MKNIQTSLRFVALGTLSVAAAFSFAQWNNAPYYSTSVQGGFQVAGKAARGTGADLNLNLAGTSGTIKKAYLSWNYLTNNSSAAGLDTVILNGNTVVANNIWKGSDLCWGFTGGANYIADVTSLVSGNGNYTLGSARDEASSFAEGATLLAIYDTGVGQFNTVDVWSGYIGSQGTNYNFVSNLSSPYGGGPNDFFINALDGQPAGDTTTINGTNAFSLLSGPFSASDNWVGNQGLYYDHGRGNISSVMNLGDTSLKFNSISNGDCIGHSFSAMSYNAVPEPGTIAAFALGALGLVARKRRK